MSMTVLHVTASLEPHAGSAAISLSHLFPLLKARGFESIVLTCDAKPIECQAATVHKFDAGSLADLLGKADLIHLHGVTPGLTDVVVERASQPIIFSPLGELSKDAKGSGGWFARRKQRARVKKLLEKTTVTALNKVERRALGATETLSYGIDAEQLRSFATTEASLPDIGDRKCLLFLGKIDPKEGLVPLLRVLAALGSAFDGWHLLLAGPDNDGWGSQMEAAVNRKGAADRVTFLRGPDMQTQVGLLRRADLLVAPSLEVRCPVAINMAVALDVPVLASPAVAFDGDAGQVHVCPPNPAGLQQALAQLLAPGDGQPSKTAASGADWSNHLDGWVNLYEKCKA